MKHVPYARKRRQLKRLVKQLKAVLQQQNAPVQIKNLVIKIRTLSLELSKTLGTFQLKRILGPAAIILGISFSNPMAAQSFAEPVGNPFGLEGGAALLLEDVITPELADIDNDGDYDLLVGFYDKMYYFENTGSATEPVFGKAQEAPFGLGAIPEYSSPALVDLDADGDLDLVLTNLYGTINFYENTGTAEAAQFGTAVSNPFGLSVAGSESPYLLSADFIDIDADGDFDAVIGGLNYSYGQPPEAHLNYFENTGTAEAPEFGEQQINPFGLSSVSALGLSPELLDIDADGDLDIIAKEFYNDETYESQFLFAENTGTASEPAFEEYVSNPFGLTSTPYGNFITSADMDNDGDTDLMVTRYAESVSDNPIIYIENTTINVSVATPAFQSSIAPNPVQDWLKIDSEKELESIQIFDLVGRSISLITDIEPSIYLGDLDNGVYLLELTSKDGKRVSKKIEKL